MDYLTESVRLTAATIRPDARLSLGGIGGIGWTLGGLRRGANEFTLTVTPPSGSAREHTIVVFRESPPPPPVMNGYSGRVLVRYTDGTEVTLTAGFDGVADAPLNIYKTVKEIVLVDKGKTHLIGRRALAELRFDAMGDLLFRDPVNGFIPIGSYAEFQLIRGTAGALGGSYKLEVDLDLMGAVAGVGDWTPVGSDSTRFSGEFDGNGCTIENLAVNRTVNDTGLFGYNTGTIRNVHIASGTIAGRDNTGAVCGTNDGGVIEYCSNGAAVTGSGYNTGGVVGTGSGTVDTECLTGCYNTGSVSGTNYVGGVQGRGTRTIRDCYNTGSVNGQLYVGGVAGRNNGSITGCYNAGAVSTNGAYTGGVVGRSGGDNGSITGCYNTGTITCTGSNVGGVVGNIDGAAGALTACYNTGSVSGYNFVGGVKGDGNGTLTACYNTGAVTGTGSNIGGVAGAGVGSGDGTITACYNTGSVNGSSSVGGVVGGVNQSALTACYWLSGTGGNAVYGIGNPASDTNAEKFSGAQWPSDSGDWAIGLHNGTPGNYWKSLGRWIDGNNGRDSVFPKLWFE